MPNVVTYRSEAASENRRWVGYVELPSGEYWMVAFYGATEDEVKNKAFDLWQKEKTKFACQYDSLVDGKPTQVKPTSQHHFAGKIWMIHSFTRARQRVNPEDVEKMLAEGWERGGPRSK